MKIEDVTPQSGYLLIEPEESEKETESGIYIPETVDVDKPQVGTVLKIGANEITEYGVERAFNLEKGKKVIYKKWGGNEIKIDKKEYLFVKFDDILGTC